LFDGDVVKSLKRGRPIPGSKSESRGGEEKKQGKVHPLRLWLAFIFAVRYGFREDRMFP